MIGKFPAKMDDKGRLFVPSKLREDLGATFYVTYGFNGKHKCLTAYTEADWKRMEANFNNLPIAQRSGPAAVLFYNAVECTPDKQFRFSLSDNLVKYAGIGRDVLIVGRAGQAEIWDVAEYEAFEYENLSPEKLLASLEAIGL